MTTEDDSRTSSGSRKAGNTEEALRESEGRFRSAFDHAPIGMALVGLDGALLQVNQALCEILGYSRDRLLTLTVHDITHPDDRKEENERKRRIRTGGSMNYQMVKRYLHADGHVVWGQLSVSLLTDALGEPIHYIGQLEDITERVRMEDELLRTRNLESLGVLAGGIAHDFNNLLTAILGNLSLAKGMTTPGDKVHERLAEAEKASLSARDLTRQLLAFSKGGAPVKSTADIGDLIRDSATFALRGSNSRCEIDAPRDLWPVEVDKGQIGQVINNLVINASQAMPDGGVVEIRCENLVPTPEGDLPVQGARRVRISVKDSGIGIPREYLSKIFDPYFTTKRKGSGLGLATVHAIVRKHGGSGPWNPRRGAARPSASISPLRRKRFPGRRRKRRSFPPVAGASWSWTTMRRSGTLPGKCCGNGATKWDSPATGTRRSKHT